MSPVSGPGILYCAECGRPSTADELARFGDLLICPACKNNYAQKLREGVAIQTTTIRYAGFWIRFVAWVIDTIILMVAGSIVQFAFLGTLIAIPQVQSGVSPDVAFGAMMGTLGLFYLVNTFIACTYESFFLSSRLSATPGKLAVGLKVLRPDGARVTLGRAVGRYFSKILSGLILLIGFIMAGFDSQKRGLHDMICDTRVIKTQD